MALSTGGVFHGPGCISLGVVIASTPQKLEISRALEGLRDMFGAVFFVAMGMLVDFRLLVSAWPLVLTVAGFALVWRPIATAAGLIVAGNDSRRSIRAGLSLSPLGEFSFVTAQLGTVAGVIPEQFFPAAVGASLLTTLIAPMMMRRSDVISAAIDRHLPLMLREWIAFYHAWLERTIGRQQINLWQLTGRRIAQAIAGILLVSALILFAKPLYAWVLAQLGPNWLFMDGTSIIFWAIFGVLILGPLVAVWRNVGVLALIVAESVTKGAGNRGLQPLIERALQGVSLIVLVLWLLALMPFGRSVLWGFLVVLGVMVLLAMIL